MYKSLVRGSLLLLAVVVGSGSASAQILIRLGQSLQNITFARVGNQINLDLGNCGLTTCTLTSNATSEFFENAVQTPPGGAGFYMITTDITNGKPFLTGNFTDGNFAYNTSMSNAATMFLLSGIDGNMMHSLRLILTFTGVTGGGLPFATFHGFYTVQSDTDTVLNAFFLNGNVGVFSFDVLTSTQLDNLSNGNSTSGPISTGTILNPEPASVALFGSGLLLLGRVLRRRKTSAPAEPSEG